MGGSALKTCTNCDFNNTSVENCLSTEAGLRNERSLEINKCYKLALIFTLETNISWCAPT